MKTVIDSCLVSIGDTVYRLKLKWNSGTNLYSLGKTVCEDVIYSFKDDRCSYIAKDTRNRRDNKNILITNIEEFYKFLEEEFPSVETREKQLLSFDDTQWMRGWPTKIIYSTPELVLMIKQAIETALKNQ